MTKNKLIQQPKSAIALATAGEVVDDKGEK